MELRILGPVEAWAGGDQVPLRGPRQARALATLVLDAGRVVTIDRLVEAVWDDPPATARRQVQDLVAGLRRSLAQHCGRGLIDTERSGYVLRAAADEVDAHRFEALVAGARRVREESPARAADAYRAALALCRGPTLAGIGSRALEPAAAGWDERRLVAWEECLAVEMTVGGSERLLGDLRALVAAHPLRERPVELLMRALYYAGDRSAALESYQDLGRRLAEATGLDPSRELQQLHQAILRDSLQAAAAPSRPSPPPSHPSPAQLPADVPGFAGRVAELGQLDANLSKLGRQRTAIVVSVLSGTAGVGKTTLAVHWAHLVRDRFPDGQLYIDLRGFAPGSPPLRPIEALARFLPALGVPPQQLPTDTEVAVGLYRTLLADRRMLVLLDNARDADQIRPLLPGGTGNLVLVTSRDQLAGLVAREGADRITLGGLNDEEAGTLLAQVLGVERVSAQPEASAELARLCGFLPLALRIAATNLSDRPSLSISDGVAALRSGTLGQLAVRGEASVAVRAAFDLSYLALAAPTRRLFRRLGLVPGADFTAGVAAVLAGVTPVEAEAELSLLVRANLVQDRGDGRFGCHDLLLWYARERTTEEDGEAATAAAIDRMYGHYLDRVGAAATRLYPDLLRLPTEEPIESSFADAAEAVAWLDAERANLTAAVLAAASNGPRAAAWRLADGLRGYFVQRMHPVDWLATAQAGLTAARAEGDLHGQAACHLSLGGAHSHLGEPEPAISEYDQAIALARRAQWLRAELAALGSMGNVYVRLGEARKAEASYTRVLRHARHGGHVMLQASALSNLGQISFDFGRLRQAADRYADAAALARQTESLNLEANALVNLGEACHALGDFPAAEEHLQRALALHRRIGARDDSGSTLGRLAALAGDRGDHDAASRLARESLALAESSGHRLYEADVLNTIGTLHRRLGQPDPAIEYHGRALDRAGESGLRYTAVAAQVGLAEAYRQRGDAGTAERYAREALAAAASGGYRVLAGHAEATLAALELDRGQAKSATEAADRAVALHRATGHRFGLAHALRLLADAQERAGRTESARVHRDAALALFADLGVPPPRPLVAGRSVHYG